MIAVKRRDQRELRSEIPTSVVDKGGKPVERLPRGVWGAKPLKTKATGHRSRRNQQNSAGEQDHGMAFGSICGYYDLL
ncbi:hypothetical protein NL676_014374 [Syzygium grande]|nr:hypothetical protein NL676_014374 [Syzygium grande]